jgi:hypothetical protein
MMFDKFKFSLKELIEQYQHATNTHFEEINQDQVV